MYYKLLGFPPARLIDFSCVETATKPTSWPEKAKEALCSAIPELSSSEPLSALWKHARGVLRDSGCSDRQWDALLIHHLRSACSAEDQKNLDKYLHYRAEGGFFALYLGEHKVTDELIEVDQIPDFMGHADAQGNYFMGSNNRAVTELLGNIDANLGKEGELTQFITVCQELSSKDKQAMTRRESALLFSTLLLKLPAIEGEGYDDRVKRVEQLLIQPTAISDFCYQWWLYAGTLLTDLNSDQAAEFYLEKARDSQNERAINFFCARAITLNDKKIAFDSSKPLPDYLSPLSWLQQKSSDLAKPLYEYVIEQAKTTENIALLYAAYNDCGNFLGKLPDLPSEAISKAEFLKIAQCLENSAYRSRALLYYYLAGKRTASVNKIKTTAGSMKPCQQVEYLRGVINGCKSVINYCHDMIEQGAEQAE